MLSPISISIFPWIKDYFFKPSQFYLRQKFCSHQFHCTFFASFFNQVSFLKTKIWLSLSPISLSMGKLHILPWSVHWANSCHWLVGFWFRLCCSSRETHLSHVGVWTWGRNAFFLSAGYSLKFQNEIIRLFQTILFRFPVVSKTDNLSFYSQTKGKHLSHIGVWTWGRNDFFFLIRYS